MAKYFKVFNLKVGSTIVLISAAAFVGAVLPRHFSVTFAESGYKCNQTFPDPRFDPYPLTYGLDAGGDLSSANSQNEVNCYDFAPISAGVTGDNTYSQNVSPKTGQTVTLRIWVHNGAATNSGSDGKGIPMEGVAYNTQETDSADGSSHTFTTTLSASGIQSVTSSVTVQTPAGSTLQVTSGDLNHYLGELWPCFDVAKNQGLFYVTLTVNTPQQQNATGTINASLNSNSCPASIDVTWQAQNPSGTIIEDQDGNVIPGSAQFSGTLNLPNAQPGKTYTYHLWNVNWVNGQPQKIGNELAEYSVNVPSNTCQQQQQPSGDFTFTMPQTDFCVYSDNSQQNDAPLYSVSADHGLIGQQIYTSSSHNNQLTSEQNYPYGGQVITVDPGNPSGNGIWHAYGNRWTVSDIGPWTKTLTINNIPHSQSFTVRDCAQAQTTQLSCRVNPVTNTTINIGGNVSFVGVGGSGNYTLNAPGSSSVYGLTAYYNTAGNYQVSISDGKQSAACPSVTVNQPTTSNPSPLVCAANTPTTISQGSSVTFTASNGVSSNQQYSYTYNANGGNPGSGQTNGNFTVSFPNTGDFPVYVTDLGSNSANCAVVHVTGNPSNPGGGQQACTPAPQGVITAPSTAAPRTNITVTCDFGTNNVTVLTPADLVNPSNVNCTRTGTNGTQAIFSCFTPDSGAITYLCNANANAGTNYCGLPQEASKIVTITSNPGPTCVQPTTGSIQLVPSSVNPGDHYEVRCDYGSRNAYINPPSGCTWPGSNGGFVGTAATFSCTAPSTAGSYNISCVAQNNSQDPNALNYCSAPTPVSTTLTVNGQAACVNLNFNSADSGLSQTSFTANSNQKVTVSCDYGKMPSGNLPDSIFPTGLNNCSYTGFTGSAANFSCDVPASVGTYPVSCILHNYPSTSNTCPLTNSVGSVIVNQPNTPLTCSATTSTSINVGGSVSFQANGQGQVSFSAPGSNGGNTIGNNGFTATYNTAGTFNVSANDSAGHQVTCATVVVNQPTQPVSCSANPSTINVGQSTTFTANQGNGSFSWSVNGGSVLNSNQQSFNSTFNTAGTYTATVTSGGSSNTCTVNVMQNVCQANTSGNFTAGSATKNTLTLTWSTSGSNLVKITRVNADGSESLITTGNSIGTFVVGGLSAGTSYTFKLYDNTCNVFIASATGQTQANPGQLTCSGPTQVNNGGQAQFTANGGTAPYQWTTSNAASPSTQNSNSNNFNTTFTNNSTSALNQNVQVVSGDGQVANCQLVVNPTQQQNGVLNIKKQVRNISQGQSSFSHSTTAKQGETVEYRIEVWSATNLTLNNVIVSDSFASGLQYVDGSLQINYTQHAPGLMNGINVGQVTQTPVIISYQAIVNVSNGTIINTAQAKADNASNNPTDQATVTVSTPVTPGQLICQVSSSIINSGGSVSFTATGGTPSYTWTDNGQTFSGASYNPTYTNSGQSAITKTVTVRDSGNPTQTVNCSVQVNGTPQQQSSGNCNNDSASCNHNNNTNNNTIGNNNTNSSNQNNNSNINGNNNTVTQTNQNCVNNSCNNTTNNNIVYIAQNGQTVPANQFAQLSITKMVSANGGGYQNSVSVSNGQTVSFQITVNNTGNTTANNVVMNDNLPGGLNLLSNSVNVNGAIIYNNNSYNNNYYGNISNIQLGNFNVGQSVTITFQATVNTGSGNVQNIATATASNASQVQASAWVYINQVTPGCTYNCVAGGNVNLTYSKKAFNETKNTDATAVNASKEDFITYTLTATNSGNAPASNFVITDDLSQVLPYADIVDNGGGTISGNVISFPGITVPANGGSVSRSFRVRVKYSLASNLSYIMTNTYGNTVTIRVNTPQVLGTFTAPKTGADSNMFIFSTLLTAGAAVFKKRKSLMTLIFS